MHNLLEWNRQRGAFLRLCTDLENGELYWFTLSDSAGQKKNRGPGMNPEPRTVLLKKTMQP